MGPRDIAQSVGYGLGTSFGPLPFIEVEWEGFQEMIVEQERRLRQEAEDAFADGDAIHEANCFIELLREQGMRIIPVRDRRGKRIIGYIFTGKEINH